MKECCQQLVRMDNITPTISAMGINDPPPAIAADCAAIAPRPTGSTELVGDDLPVFHLSMARFSLTEFAKKRRDPEEKYTLFVCAVALVIVLVKILWE